MSRKAKHATGEQHEQEARESGQESENMTDAGNQASETEKMSASSEDTAAPQEPATESTETLQGPGPEELLAQWQEKYLRLSADFDNYRKRTRRENTELVKSAGEDVLVSILPIVDDFDRALKSMETAQDLEAVKLGVQLIHGKFKEFLSQRGIKEIEALHQPFNLDLHEAVTKIPAPGDELKGKNVDVLTKGYMLYDKVVRYAKVVIGE